MKKNITIIGVNPYSVSLSNVLADNHHNVIIFTNDQIEEQNINFNHIYNNLKINKKIIATNDLIASLENVEILILSTTYNQLESMINEIKKYLKKPVILINTITGFDETNLDLLSNFIIKQFKNTSLLKEYVSLYGPSNASEIILKKPSSCMIVSNDLNTANMLVEIFSNEYFLCYVSNDLNTCQLVVYFKDLINLSLGILDQLDAGSNAKASLITIIINLIYQITKNYQTRLESFFNFATLATIFENILTNNSIFYKLGVDIVRFNDTKKALEKNNLTLNQIQVVKIAYLLCDKYQIHNQFINTLYKILYNNIRPIALLNHSFKGVWLV
ncbi:Glycerol-3-phosphate dehydrogenase [NAD(P)+] [Mycoplasma feriruminatoris]|uniref:glycerol-3-phosphate dehydrogenase n=1 Tax=Mycoplasma feriruminatoris TaxID=1179777 RepID=UPI00241FB41A|nr:glycerol-3-phosphate dehydrogenase [Mycoplasma feriruminatoris]WFQ91906.1 Glycerol-3-phosphate dehydrogenase [NAD(P)+] [Mycoplasma feriruminatoris]